MTIVPTLVLLAISTPRLARAQAIDIDSAASARIVKTAAARFRTLQGGEASRNALADSLVAMATRPRPSDAGAKGLAEFAVIRLSRAGRDPQISYRGAAERLKTIAAETPFRETAALAVAALTEMRDTSSAVVALEQLATHPEHSFRAIFQLVYAFKNTEEGTKALLRLYANRGAIPNATARDFLVERLRFSGLVREP